MNSEVKNELKVFGWIAGAFLFAYFLPLSNARVQTAIMEAFYMVQDYARQHVLTCLVPAFFIAGAIQVFLSQQSVMKYLGASAKKTVSYGVASVSGAILAVCSCTVMPIFTSIYKRGAGLGPAIAFLYSGPAINILAIVLTARVLGWQIGLARAIGAVLFSIIIGLIMTFLFRKEEKVRQESFTFVDNGEERNPAKTVVHFIALVGILIFATFAKPLSHTGLAYVLFSLKWYIVIILVVFVVFATLKWFKEEQSEWLASSWGFAKKLMPLLLGGVLVAGFLMGRAGTDNGIIPAKYVSMLVGGNSILSNFVASVVGAFMYFATLTEIPILQGLLGAGMGKGPALALLLSGPALSLPSMLVINSVLGFKKTFAYVALVIIMSTATGLIFGALV